MRRGYLYEETLNAGCNKIALGHHFDDIIETTLMGILFGGQVQTMMPKLHSTSHPGMELIRPMYLIREDDIKHWRDYNDLYFLQCACKFTETCATCHTVDGPAGSKCQATKELIRRLRENNSQVDYIIFHAMENVNLGTVLGWKGKDGAHGFLDTIIKAQNHDDAKERQFCPNYRHVDKPYRFSARPPRYRSISFPAAQSSAILTPPIPSSKQYFTLKQDSYANISKIGGAKTKRPESHPNR